MDTIETTGVPQPGSPLLSSESSQTNHFFLFKIKYYEPIPIERELELLRLIENGDAQAARQLIEQFVPLVLRIVKEYINRGLSLYALLEEGGRALANAVTQYRLVPGMRFSHYACQSVIAALEASLTYMKPVSHPVTKDLVIEFNRYIQWAKELQARYDYSLGDWELIDSLLLRLTDARSATVADVAGLDP